MPDNSANIEKEALLVSGSLAALWFAFNALMAAGEGVNSVKQGYKGFKSLGQGDYRGALGHAGKSALSAAFAAMGISGMGSGLKMGSRALRTAGGGSKLLKARKASKAAGLGNTGFWKAWRLRNRGALGGVGRSATPKAYQMAAHPYMKSPTTNIPSQYAIKARNAFKSRPAWADQAWQARWGNRLNTASRKMKNIPGIKGFNKFLDKHPYSTTAGFIGAGMGLQALSPEEGTAPKGLPNQTSSIETPRFDYRTYRPFGYNQRSMYQRPNNMYKQSSEMSVLLSASKKGLISPQQRQLLAALNRSKEV